MAEQVRIHTPLDSGHAGQVQDQLLYTRLGQRFVGPTLALRPALERHEQAIGRGVLRPAPVGVFADARAEARDGHQPRPVALGATTVAAAGDAQIVLPALRGDVADPELHQLPHPHAGVGQCADDELVALRPGGILHRLDLLAGQHLSTALGSRGNCALALTGSPSRSAQARKWLIARM